jgi:hypothetical protein
MRKNLLVLIGVFISLNLFAQDSPWAVEAKFTPFFLGAINSEKDFNIENDGISGGVDAGMTIKRYLSAPWSLETGIIYSSQKFNGIQSGAVPEGSDLSYSLEYYKFPLLVNYDWSWDYKKDLKLTLGGGGQILHLNDYKGTREDRLQVITIENGERILYIKDDDEVRSVIEGDFFSDTRLGLVGYFGFEKRFSESFSYSLKLKTEYDLNLIGNEAGYDLSYFRIGLEFGIRYRFKKAGPVHIEGIL